MHEGGSEPSLASKNLVYEVGGVRVSLGRRSDDGETLMLLCDNCADGGYTFTIDRKILGACVHIEEATRRGTTAQESDASREINLAILLCMDDLVAPIRNLALVRRKSSIAVFVASVPGLTAIASTSLVAGSQVSYYVGSVPHAASWSDIASACYTWASQQTSWSSPCIGLLHSALSRNDDARSFDAATDRAFKVLTMGLCPACSP